MESRQPKFRLQSFSIFFGVISLTVVSAFAIVWMQQTISRTAQKAVSLEADLAKKVDQLRYLDKRISTSHQPVTLQGKVTGSLRPAKDLQVVWVAERSSSQGRIYANAGSSPILQNLAFFDRNNPR
jgi:hypothetical protein